MKVNLIGAPVRTWYRPVRGAEVHSLKLRPDVSWYEVEAYANSRRNDGGYYECRPSLVASSEAEGTKVSRHYLLQAQARRSTEVAERV